MWLDESGFGDDMTKRPFEMQQARTQVINYFKYVCNTSPSLIQKRSTFGWKVAYYACTRMLLKAALPALAETTSLYTIQLG